MPSCAVFLDRDGTVNVEEEYLSAPDLMKLERGAAEGLRALQSAGFLLVIVSNQSGVARGLFREEDVRRANERLQRLLAEQAIEIDAFYYCPHHPSGSVAEYARDCTCRKPAPGMFLEAAQDLEIDLGSSYAIGDRARDLEAGRRAGTKTVLVKTGYGANSLEEVLARKLADYVAEDLVDAAQWILKEAERAGKKDVGG